MSEIILPSVPQVEERIKELQAEIRRLKRLVRFLTAIVPDPEKPTRVTPPEKIPESSPTPA